MYVEQLMIERRRMAIAAGITLLPLQPPPLPNTYWVQERFLAGEYPGSRDAHEAQQKIQTLITSGVTHFIDLTEDRDGLEPYAPLLPKTSSIGQPIIRRHHPIRDQRVPDTYEAMDAIVDDIEAFLALEATVYVHCWGGIGRTGMVVACYLVRQGYTGDLALAKLALLWERCSKSATRPRSPESLLQDNWVLEWAGRR